MAKFSSNLSGDSRYSIALEVTEKSYSIIDNTSDVDYKLTATKSSGTGYYDKDVNSPITVAINGSTVVNKKIAYDFTGSTPKTITLASGTVKGIAHNTDGKKSISVSASFTDASNGRGSASVSGTVTLTTIPRKTTPSLSATTVTMGSNITITLSPADSSFKHKIGYDFGNLKGQTSGLSIGANFTAQGNSTVTFTPPTSLGNQIPSANSGTCTIYCYTYNSSGTHIGTVTQSITLNIPSYTPVINNVTLTGNNLLSGVYVQGKSTVTVNAALTTSYGAGVKSVSIEVDGKTYTSLPFTSSVLSNGSKTIKITFTDTRNKSVPYTSSAFTVYPYSAPTITAFNLERQADGTTVIASISGSISPLNNKNTKGFSITLNGVTNYLNPSGYDVNGSTTFTNVPTDNTFTATARIADYYTSTQKNATLPTVAVTMDFYKDGNGIAMGKVAEEGNLLDVNWKSKFRKILNVISDSFDALIVTRTASNSAATIKFTNGNGSLGYIGMNGVNSGLTRWSADGQSGYPFLDAGNTKDYIVERGTSDIWTYEKWNSGKVVCWGNVSTSPTTVNGNNAITVNLPITFVGTDYKVDITPAKAAMYVDAFGDCATNGTITHTTTNFTMSYKYSYGTAYAVSFNVTVRGKWK